MEKKQVQNRDDCPGKAHEPEKIIQRHKKIARGMK